jgi:hypothetical protein
MRIERSIRSMTPEEMQAKRQWGTDTCQAPRCGARAAYLVLETGAGDGEWWQYCCRKHASLFASQHGLDLPAQPAAPPRAAPLHTEPRA